MFYYYFFKLAWCVHPGYLNVLSYRYGDRFTIISLSWLGVVHQSPSLGRYRCRSRVICVDMLARPTRCGRPVPQPLSVMNSVKAKGEKGMMAGEGMLGVKSKGFLRHHF